MKHESGTYTPKALRIPAPKTSSSDSKLTVDYFQGSEHSVTTFRIYLRWTFNSMKFLFQLQLPEEMSHSAPQPHPLESDSESSLSPKIMSEEEITREVGGIYIIQMVVHFNGDLISGPENNIIDIGKSVRSIFLSRRRYSYI